MASRYLLPGLHYIALVLANPIAVQKGSPDPVYAPLPPGYVHTSEVIPRYAHVRRRVFTNIFLITKIQAPGSSKAGREAGGGFCIMGFDLANCWGRAIITECYDFNEVGSYHCNKDIRA